MSQQLFIADTKYTKLGELNRDYDFFHSIMYPIEITSLGIESSTELIERLREHTKEEIAPHKDTLRAIFRVLRERELETLEIHIF